MDTFLETTKSYFNTYYVDVLKNQYTDFKGKATRSQYWYFILFYTLIVLVLNLLDGWFFTTPILSLTLALALAVPTIALGVRRLHDLNLSGWIYLIILVPVLGALALLVLFCLPSQPTKKIK